MPYQKGDGGSNEVHRDLLRRSVGVNERIDGRLLIITTLLVLCGLVILYSASAPFSLRRFGSGTFMLFKQFIAAVAGAAALVFFVLFDYHRLAAINDLLLVALTTASIGSGAFLTSYYLKSVR